MKIKIVVFGVFSADDLCLARAFVIFLKEKVFLNYSHLMHDRYSVL